MDALSGRVIKPEADLYDRNIDLHMANLGHKLVTRILL